MASPPADSQSKHANGAVVFDNGAVVVFAIGTDRDSATSEMVDHCRRYGAEPLILDATTDPLFAEHLKDSRVRAHFPLLCVRGGLVGGLEVVRQLEARGQLRDVLSSPSGGAADGPRIALSQGAALELERALTEPDQCIRLVISSEFEHQLSVDTPQPNDTKLMLGEIPLLLDTESAARANGMAIDWIETPEGHAFRIDNPNRPEPVRHVDRAWLTSDTRPLGLFVIDVRTPAEYGASHIEGARLLDATLMDELEGLDRRTPLLFYCNGGIRSKKAADHYRALGYTEVYCLT